MKPKQKLWTLALIVLLLASLSSTFFLGSVKAYSAQSTGLTLSGEDRGQGKVATCDSYSIFVTDTELLAYTSSASLAWTWNIPFAIYNIGNTTDGYTTVLNQTIVRTDVTTFNSTCVLVVSSFGGCYQPGSGGVSEVGTYAEWFLLNVASLTYSNYYATVSFEQGTGNRANHLQEADQVLIYDSAAATWYLVTGSRDSSIERCYEVALNSVNDFSYGESHNGYCYSGSQALMGCSLWIPSYTTNQFFIVTRNSLTGLRATVWLFNDGAGTLTSVGTLGADYTYPTWGSSFPQTVFIDYGGSTNVTLGASQYIDLLVGFGYYSNNGLGMVSAECLRMNASFVTYAQISINPGGTGFANPLRTLCVYPESQLLNGNLTDGLYGIEYLAPDGTGQFIWEDQDVNLTGTLSTSLGLYGSGSPVSFQGALSPYVFVTSQTSGGIGGFLEPDMTVGINFDYGHGTAYADTFIPSESELTYAYSLSPAPNYQNGYTCQVNASLGYTLTGELQLNGAGVTGTVHIDFSIWNSSYGYYEITGSPVSITNGVFSFSFSSGSYTVIYVQLTYTLTSVSITGSIDQTILVHGAQYQSGTGAPTGGGGNAPGGGGSGGGPTSGPGSGGGGFNLGWFTSAQAMLIYGIIILALLCVVFAYLADFSGLIVGLMIGLIVGILFFNFPSWVLLPLVLCIVALIFLGRQSGGK